MLQWSSQSLYLNLIEMPWWDLKRAVHKQIPVNLNELKHRCKGEWANIPTQ